MIYVICSVCIVCLALIKKRRQTKKHTLRRRKTEAQRHVKRIDEVGI